MLGCLQNNYVTTEHLFYSPSIDFPICIDEKDAVILRVAGDIIVIHNEAVHAPGGVLLGALEGSGWRLHLVKD